MKSKFTMGSPKISKIRNIPISEKNLNLSQKIKDINDRKSFVSKLHKKKWDRVGVIQKCKEKRRGSYEL